MAPSSTGFHHASLSVRDLDRSAFGLVEHRGATDDGFRPDRTGLDHLAFDVESLGEARRWAEHLGDHGVDRSGVVEIPTGAICNFRDPDGIQLALFWEKPT